MEWLNIWGMIFIVVIMIPNIIFAHKYKDGFGNAHISRIIICTEQIGRYGCIGFMIFNIPGTWFGWWSNEAFAIYLIIDILLIALYCILWIIYWNKTGVCKALWLSIIPSVTFLFSGIMSRSILLILAVLLFSPPHIYISYKNAI